MARQRGGTRMLSRAADGDSLRAGEMMMTESNDLTHTVADLQGLLAEKLGLRKGGFDARMRRAGRRLPRRIHRDARVIGKAMELGAHPKLRRRIDTAAVAAAHRRMRLHLKAIDPRDRRRGFMLGMLGGLAFNLLAAGALLVALLNWRGLI
jgi:hypothetical protein